jgi:hypothetical protein
MKLDNNRRDNHAFVIRYRLKNNHAVFISEIIYKVPIKFELVEQQQTKITPICANLRRLRTVNVRRGGMKAALLLLVVKFNR